MPRKKIIRRHRGPSALVKETGSCGEDIFAVGFWKIQEKAVGVN